MSVLEQHIRTVSVLSVLPAYFLRNLCTLCVLSLYSLRGLRVAFAAGRLYSQMSSVLCPRRPYSHHTASVAIRCYPREMLANLSTRYCIRTGSVLSPPISANVNKIPYSLREISSVLYPLRSAASVCRCERGLRHLRGDCKILS